MAMIFMGWRRYQKARAIAFLLLIAAFLTQILLMRAFFDFTGAAFIQPRYFFPVALVLIGVALSMKSSRAFLNRFQALSLTIVLTIAGSIAWQAVSTRYAIGPEAAYTNFGQPIEWWWPVGPGRLSSFILVTACSALWVSISIYMTATLANQRRQQEISESIH